MSPIAAHADCGQLHPRPQARWLHDSLPRTLGGLLPWRAERTPQQPAFHLGEPGQGSLLTWAQAAALVEEVAAGLLLLGLPAAAVVAVAGSAGVEAVLVEWAIARAAAGGVGLHPAASSDEVQDVLLRSEASVLIAEDATQLAKVREHWSRLPHLRAVVVLDSDAVGPGSVHAGDQRVLSLDALRARGRAALGVDPALVSDVVARIGPDDVAALVHTVGQEGVNELVPVTHEALIQQAAAVVDSGRVDERTVALLCLPAFHPLGRIWRSVHLVLGFVSAVVDDLDHLVRVLPVVRPSIVVTLTPTVQRGQSQARLRLAADRRAPSRVARWALGEMDDDRSAQQVLAGALTRPRLRAVLGGRLRYVVCDSAVSDPARLDPTVGTWYARLGVQVLDGTGRSVDGVAAPSVVRPATAAPWSAQGVQARFAAVCPYAGHLVRFGRLGARVALLTLDADAMATWSQQQGMAGERYQDVVASAAARSMAQRYLDRLNADLPTPERIRHFEVLPAELSVADGTLSWDLRVRRRPLASRHAEVLAEWGAG